MRSETVFAAETKAERFVFWRMSANSLRCASGKASTSSRMRFKSEGPGLQRLPEQAEG